MFGGETVAPQNNRAAPGSGGREARRSEMAHGGDTVAFCVYAQVLPGPHCTSQSPYFNFIIGNRVRKLKYPKVIETFEHLFPEFMRRPALLLTSGWAW